MIASYRKGIRGVPSVCLESCLSWFYKIIVVIGLLEFVKKNCYMECVIKRSTYLVGLFDYIE